MVINQAAARRLNRQNQKAKKASAATSAEGTPERSTGTGKRIHTTIGGSPSSHPIKKARLDSTLHLQEVQAIATTAAEPTQEARDEVIDSIALVDADFDERTVDADMVNAVLAAEEAGLEQALSNVTRDEDESME